MALGYSNPARYGFGVYTPNHSMVWVADIYTRLGITQAGFLYPAEPFPAESIFIQLSHGFEEYQSSWVWICDLYIPLGMALGYINPAV